MNQSLDYDALAALCPPGIEPAYDELVADLGAMLLDRLAARVKEEVETRRDLKGEAVARPHHELPRTDWRS